MVNKYIEKIENAAKVILERTTPQAFLLWFFMYCIPDGYIVNFLGFEADKFTLSFIALIVIGLAFSEIIGKLQRTEIERDSLKKENLNLFFEIKTYRELNDIEKKKTYYTTTTGTAPAGLDWSHSGTTDDPIK